MSTERETKCWSDELVTISERFTPATPTEDAYGRISLTIHGGMALLARKEFQNCSSSEVRDMMVEWDQKVREKIERAVITAFKE